MIQPNELRIGSIVFAYPFRIIRVSEINANGVLNQGDETEEPFIFEDLEGIPLTPEILEKTGFNLLKKSSGYMGFVLVDFEVGFTYGNFYFDATNREGYRNEVYVEIKYVHQLQNLYFALTGTELEIKL